MKRFYCTICQSVKRVRRLPSNTQSVNSMTPEKRIGTCDKHALDTSDEMSIGKSTQGRNQALKMGIPVIEIRKSNIRSNRKVN